MVGVSSLRLLGLCPRPIAREYAAFSRLGFIERLPFVDECAQRWPLALRDIGIVGQRPLRIHAPPFAVLRAAHPIVMNIREGYERTPAHPTDDNNLRDLTHDVMTL